MYFVTPRPEQHQMPLLLWHLTYWESSQKVTFGLLKYLACWVPTNNVSLIVQLTRRDKDGARKYKLTDWRCTVPRLWRSKHGTWTAVWTRSPCWSCRMQLESLSCILTAASLPMENRPTKETSLELDRQLKEQAIQTRQSCNRFKRQSIA